MPRILPVTSAHFPVIQQIATTTWYPTYGHILTQAQTDYMLEWMYGIDSLKEQVEEKGIIFMMIQNDGATENEFAGFTAYEFDYEGRPKTRIHKLYVLPEMHGQGFGKQMLDFIASEAVAHQNTGLHLNVNRFNKAISFYQKYGFEITGEEDIDIGQGYLMEDYIMEKGV